MPTSVHALTSSLMLMPLKGWMWMDVHFALEVHTIYSTFFQSGSLPPPMKSRFLKKKTFYLPFYQLSVIKYFSTHKTALS